MIPLQKILLVSFVFIKINLNINLKHIQLDVFAKNPVLHCRIPNQFALVNQDYSEQAEECKCSANCK